MIEDIEPKSPSTVNLVRSSQPWTKADSAAGFVLRYLVPVRRQLTDVLGSTEAADGSLKVLLAHLVSVGFGEHRQGRLRDYLLRALRSAARMRSGEGNGNGKLEANLETLTPESKSWVAYWRDGLLERAWRSLERYEHAHADRPVYTVLTRSTENPQATAGILASMLQQDDPRQWDAARVEQLLPLARTMLAQLIADEVAETLENPTREDVKREIMQLGLGRAFVGMQV
ncbi:MAG: hypothetical protein AAF958_18590 [Planctomycetota bacterium]